MYLNTPITTLMSESDIIPAYILLDFWQRKYVYRFLNFLELIPTKTILLITLQIRNKDAQPKNQSKDN